MHCALCFSYEKMGYDKLRATHNPAEWPFEVHANGTLDVAATLSKTVEALGCGETPATLQAIDEADDTVQRF